MRPLPVFACVFLALNLPLSASAGTLDIAKIALHVKAPTVKTGTLCTTWSPITIPCSQYNTQGRVGTEQVVYLVVGNVGAAGVRGVELGIDYNPAPGAGIDVLAWTRCASSEILHDGVNGAWPAAHSGLWALWNTCQNTWLEPNGGHLVIGALSVYAYDTDTLHITADPVYQGDDACDRRNVLTLIDCQERGTSLAPASLAYAVFSPYGDVPGFNPCPPTVTEYLHIDQKNPIFPGTLVGATNYKAIDVRNLGVVAISGTIAAVGDDYSLTAGSGSYVLQPGETRKLVVQFTPSSLGPKRGQVQVSDEWPPIELWGVGVCDLGGLLVVWPPRFDCGPQLVGTTREVYVPVLNSSGCSSAYVTGYVGYYEGALNPAFGFCDPTPVLVPPLGTVYLPITFSPIEEGSTWSTLFLSGSMNSSSNVELRGEGVVEAPVCRVEPTIFEFEPLIVGESAYGEFSIRNDCSNCGVLTVSISENSEDLEVLSGRSYDLVAGTGVNVPFRFTPAADGYRTGTIEVTTNSGSNCPSVTVSGFRRSAVQAARAWLEPGTLNATALGPWVKALLELPEPYSPEQIEVRTVTAFDSIPADSMFFEVGDTDSNGVAEAAVRFHRQALLRNVPEAGDSLAVPIRGHLGDAAVFAADPSLRVVRPRTTRPQAGDVFVAGSLQYILWESPPSWSIDHVEVSYSLDGGASWNPALGPTDGGAYLWQVPREETNRAMVRIAVYDAYGLLGMDASDGTFVISLATDVGDPGHEQPVLLQNSPNPFTRGTAIGFAINQNSWVALKIFDVRGQLVRILVDEPRPAGNHQIFWDGRDGSGRTVSDGVYLYHVKAAGLDQTRRMLKIGG